MDSSLWFKKYHSVKVNEQIFLQNGCSTCTLKLERLEMTGKHQLEKGSDKEYPIELSFDHLTPIEDGSMLLTRDLIVFLCCAEKVKKMIHSRPTVTCSLKDDDFNFKIEKGQVIIPEKFDNENENTKKRLVVLFHDFQSLRSKISVIIERPTDVIRVFDKNTNLYVEMYDSDYEIFSKYVQCEEYKREWAIDANVLKNYKNSVNIAVRNLEVPNYEKKLLKILNKKISDLKSDLDGVIENLKDCKGFLKRKHKEIEETKKCNKKIKKVKSNLNKIEYDRIKLMKKNKSNIKKLIVGLTEIISKYRDGEKPLNEVHSMSRIVNESLSDFRFFAPYILANCPTSILLQPEEGKQILKWFMTKGNRAIISTVLFSFLCSILWNIPFTKENIDYDETFSYVDDYDKYFEYNQNTIQNQVEDAKRRYGDLYEKCNDEDLSWSTYESTTDEEEEKKDSDSDADFESD